MDLATGRSALPTDVNPEAIIDRINSALRRLEPSALEVVSFIADRMVAGRAAYGDLDVNDGRDWMKEASQELGDCSVYFVCELLKNTLARQKART